MSDWNAPLTLAANVTDLPLLTTLAAGITAAWVPAGYLLQGTGGPDRGPGKIIRV